MQTPPLTSNESYTPSDSQNNDTSQTSSNNKRPRSFTPEQERDIGSPGDSSSPKRTMSEEHLHSRESSPVVSLPTGENATNPQVPTKMTEVFPPLAAEVERVVGADEQAGRHTPSGSLPGFDVEPAGRDVNDEMTIDDERSSGAANPTASTNPPTLQEQFEIVKGENALRGF